jgi:uncharacterized membrane protein
MDALGVAALIAAIALAVSVATGIALVVWLARRGEIGEEIPKQILARRFAQGDIDEEEFRIRLSALADAGQKCA